MNHEYSHIPQSLELLLLLFEDLLYLSQRQLQIETDGEGGKETQRERKREYTCTWFTPHLAAMAGVWANLKPGARVLAGSPMWV